MLKFVSVIPFFSLLLAETVPNDYFNEAQKLPGYLRLTKEGRLMSSDGETSATRESGEPRHAGRPGAASVWYRWQPVASERVFIEATAEKAALLLAVYQGRSVDQLKEVPRYPRLDYPASSRMRKEPFTSSARVEIEAEEGAVYYIAVDTENRVRDEFKLRIYRSENTLDPISEIYPVEGKWESLLAKTKDGLTFDPEGLDPDFDRTWRRPESYDGPGFSRPSRGPFGWGVLDFGKLRTPLGGKGYFPPEGERYTAYFRTEIIPKEDVRVLGIEGVFDDGAIFYLDDEEIGRINVDQEKDADDWKTVADAPTNRVKVGSGQDMAEISAEKVTNYLVTEGLSLRAGKPFRLAVSLHNADPQSSDLGMSLRVYSLKP